MGKEKIQSEKLESESIGPASAPEVVIPLGALAQTPAEFRSETICQETQSFYRDDQTMGKTQWLFPEMAPVVQNKEVMEGNES